MLKLNNVLSALTPAANKVILYAKGGLIYKKASDGIEQVLGGTTPMVVQDEGVSVTPRTKLNFVGAGISLQDDSANDASIVNVTGVLLSPPPRAGWFADPGALQLLMRRTAVNAEDDHFDGTSLDAKWKISGVLANQSFTDIPGWFGFGYTATGSSSTAAILQSIPAGDWSAETEVLWATFPTAVGWGQAGLCLTNGVNIASQVMASISSGQRNSAGLARINTTKFTNGAYTSNYLEVLSSGMNNDHQFFKIVKSSTTYIFLTSENGFTWQFFYSANAATLGFTPTHFGMLALNGSPSYFNYFLRY